MSDPLATATPAEHDLLVRDADGTLVPLDEARRAVRALGAVDDDEARAANRAGRVHPSQTDRLGRPGWGGEIVLVVLGASAGLTTGVLAIGYAASDQGVAAGRAALATVAIAVGTLVGAVLTRSRRVAHRRHAPVVTLREPLRTDRVAPGHDTPPLIGRHRLALHPRFVGLPVVVHLIDTRVPVVLSADLDDEALQTVRRPSVDTAARTKPVDPPVVLHGRGRRGEVTWTVISALLLVASLAGVAAASTTTGRALGWFAAALTGFSLLLALIVWPEARREAGSRYEIVDDAAGATVTAHRPGRPPVVVTSAALEHVEQERGSGRRSMWRLVAGATRLSIPSPGGETAARALLRRRPDLGIVTTRTGN